MYARAIRYGFVDVDVDVEVDVDVDVDVHAALAGWMHRVCADLAGCWETSVLCLVRLG